MRKVCLIFAVLFLLISPRVFAASLTLDYIDSLATNGKVYTEWWYTGTNPVLSGSSPAGSEVSVIVDSSSHKVTADSSGKWSYATGLGAGDYVVSISSNGDSLSFKLHLGQSLPETFGTSQSSSSVPQTGSKQLALLGLSVFSVMTGWYVLDRKNALRSFENSLSRK